MENAEFKNSSLHFYLLGVRTLLIIGLLPLDQPPQQKFLSFQVAQTYFSLHGIEPYRKICCPCATITPLLFHISALNDDKLVAPPGHDPGSPA